MTLALVTAWGEEHGLINKMPNSVPDDDFKHADPKIKDTLRKKKKDNARLVKARYINHEERERGRLDKTYTLGAGSPLEQYHLIHDYEYTLPMGLIEEVNAYRMPVRAGLQSVDGNDVTSDGRPLERDGEKRVHELVPVSFN